MLLVPYVKVMLSNVGVMCMVLVTFADVEPSAKPALTMSYPPNVGSPAADGKTDINKEVSHAASVKEAEQMQVPCSPLDERSRKEGVKFHSEVTTSNVIETENVVYEATETEQEGDTVNEADDELLPIDLRYVATFFS